MGIPENIEEIREKITNAAKACGRSVQEITLVGVTKTVDTASIIEAVNCGIATVGENKAQELCEKYDTLAGLCKIHFIGHLQTNKVKYVIDKVDMIESVDSLRLAQEIDVRAGAINRSMDILAEVNIGKERSKHGVLEEDLEDFLKNMSKLSNVKIRGLMTVLPVESSFTEHGRSFFERMYQLFIDIRSKKKDNINMDFLSMGMTNDYETAIEYGANIVRIGTGIFGRRNY